MNFVTKFPIKRTMVFEEYYPKGLSLSYQEKLAVTKTAYTVWLLNDLEEPVGEVYAFRLDRLPEAIEGTCGFPPKTTAYIYSATVLKEWQGKGLGHLLKAYMLGYLKAKRFKKVIAHAREGASIHVAQKLGGTLVKPYYNWHDSGETYYLYEVNL